MIYSTVFQNQLRPKQEKCTADGHFAHLDLRLGVAQFCIFLQKQRRNPLNYCTAHRGMTEETRKQVKRALQSALCSVPRCPESPIPLPGSRVQACCLCFAARPNGTLSPESVLVTAATFDLTIVQLIEAERQRRAQGTPGKHHAAATSFLYRVRGNRDWRINETQPFGP